MPKNYRRPHQHERVQAVERMRRAWAAGADARATVRAFNARASAGRPIRFWPKIAAATTAKHPWLTIICDGCGGVTNLDLRMKPRNAEASIAMKDETPFCVARFGTTGAPPRQAPLYALSRSRLAQPVNSSQRSLR